MHRDVAILASDSLRGREAGTLGEQMAADYISKQMRQVGLLPGGDSAGSYLSAFRMNYPVNFKAATLKVDGVIFKYHEDFGATDLSASGDVTAPLVNIGKEISLSGKTNWKSDVKGKIVVLDIANGFKRLDNAKVLAMITARVKAVVDAGSLGVILHNSSRQASEDVLFGSPFTASLTVPVVYLARLPYNKISKLKTASCTLSVEIDRTVLKPLNVTGRIDNKSQHTVVIGAHYDHVGITRPRKGDDRSPQVHNGADDNASGTAALLELARWAVNNETLKYNYIFVAFSAEEKGLFGSKAFCSRSEINKETIDYMLNMDMVGRLGCQGDTINVLGVASSPAWEPLIDSLEHPEFSIRKINGAPPFSDHSPFLKKGIPVIYFTTGLHPDYHTPNDDTELLNYQGMAELVAYIRQFIRSAEALPAMPFHKINVLQQARALIQTF
jgi:Zn-dependent M28 family amino/carboxypeptidase